MYHYIQNSNFSSRSFRTWRLVIQTKYLLDHNIKILLKHKQHSISFIDLLIYSDTLYSKRSNSSFVFLYNLMYPHFIELYI